MSRHHCIEEIMINDNPNTNMLCEFICIHLSKPIVNIIVLIDAVKGQGLFSTI